MNKIYDTHCHVNTEPLVEDIKNIYQECKQNNMIANVIGVDVPSSLKAIEIAKQYQDVFHATIAIHPNDVEELSFAQIDELIKQLKQMLEKDRQYIVGIGETGIDRHFNNSEEVLEKQIYSLKKHIELCEQYQLPLILHVRDGNKEMIDFLSKHKVNQNIIIHCFSGNKEDAINYQKLGCYISYSGVVTFKNAQDLVESVPFVDKTKILAETDAPYLAPVPFRGKTNMPWYTEYSINKISEILGEDMHEQIYQNSLKAFNIKTK